MNEMNFDWDDLRLFLAVAREGGLAAAAAQSGKSPPTLGRRMLSLERRIGLDLFRRLARGYELTEDGHALLSKVKELEKQILPIVTVQNTPVVKVSAGLWVTHLLCDHVADIISQDQIRLRFIAADEQVDIGRREALIGIRNQRPEGPGLAGRRVTRIQFAVYARDGNVKTWARVIGSTPSAKWVLQMIDGGDSIEVTSPRNALDLALTGTARVVLPTFIGRHFGALKQVTPVIDELEHDQWLVTHHEDRFVPEVRKVIDRIFAILKKHQT
ncbi:LysR family transcriptional regulator [Litoreibacter meonggei]|uniref:LysR family transcriptional regulator n=1 Tax=Litoreibacter meonggei TaxID=1049199 RepID=A0A497WNW6_9RHOB|nr:LysR family transcriptional regulator [Litoreibacter meonggei]RLJ51639.1 LysR family transcriptional regulator [Litoreibacter meonggei]